MYTHSCEKLILCLGIDHTTYLNDFFFVRCWYSELPISSEQHADLVPGSAGAPET